MQVFKSFFKISKKYLGTTICFAIVFLVLSLSLANQQSNNSVDDFKNYQLKLSIFDYDNSQISESLCKYLESKHTIIELEDDIDEFRDAMYSRKVHYILVIPEGFGASLSNTDTNNATALLDSYKLSSYAAQFADMQIDKFISIYSTYLKIGADATTAYENTLKTIEKQVDVAITEQEETGSETPYISIYYQYLPYLFIASIVSAISPILISFNKVEMQKRTFCSSYSHIKYNISLILGCCVFTLAIFMLYLITSFVIEPSVMFSTAGLLMIINAILAAITALAFGFLFAQLTDSMNIISALSNIFGLGSSFLCGVFVPREYLGDTVTNIGKFLPAHWYINVNQEISGTTIGNTSTILSGYIVQILFIVALFTMAIVANKIKNRH